MAYKRATGKTGMAPARTKGTSKGMKSTSNGPGPAKTMSGNKSGQMGVGAGSGGRVAQGGDAGGFAAGRQRTSSGKNNTGSGPQGFKG